LAPRHIGKKIEYRQNKIRKRDFEKRGMLSQKGIGINEESKKEQNFVGEKEWSQEGVK